MSHILINLISHITHPISHITHTILSHYSSNSHMTHSFPMWLSLSLFWSFWSIRCPFLSIRYPFFPLAPHMTLPMTQVYHMTISHDMSHDWLHNLSTWFDYIIDHMICHMIYHLTCHLIHHLTCHLTFIFSPQRSWVGWGCCWEDQGVVEEKVEAEWCIGVWVCSKMCINTPNCS